MHPVSPQKKILSDQITKCKQNDCINSINSINSTSDDEKTSVNKGPIYLNTVYTCIKRYKVVHIQYIMVSTSFLSL